ncbi:hypothetical protein, partial [Nocardioides sp.]|uniref:hypothetical protein n=1 Tax=Nocardioides sp. TaxID=35761 RepID=UPI002CC0750E
MSTSSQTHVLDHLREHVEESDFALTERLGLRPTHYPDSSDKATHPDQRPCPPWCWVGQNKEYGHEIEWNYPATALHSMEGVPTVFASRYAGHCSGNSSTGDRDIRAATIEPHLKQRGQGEPVIDVY